jgi:hypothetical protein
MAMLNNHRVHIVHYLQQFNAADPATGAATGAADECCVGKTRAAYAEFFSGLGNLGNVPVWGFVKHREILFPFQLGDVQSGNALLACFLNPDGTIFSDVFFVENHGKSDVFFPDIYPLVNVYITMENHHAINEKIHYFYGHVQ